MLTRDNFGQLMTPVHRMIAFQEYGRLDPQYTRIFDDVPMRAKTDSMVRYGDMGLWDENSEGNTINEDAFSEGQQITFTTKRYDKGYEITWELAQDDLYGLMQGNGKGGSAIDLGQGLYATVETTAMSVLNGGFANTGYDGVSLFSASHTLIDSPATFSNLATGALSDANLKLALILLRKTPNEANIKVPIIPKHLIVPVEQEFSANEILFSAGVTGNSNNNKNTLPALSIEVMDYLTSTTAWFVKAGNVRNLVHRWREKPWFDSQPIPKKVDKFFFGYGRWTQGYQDVRGIVGSTGQ